MYQWYLVAQQWIDLPSYVTPLLLLAKSLLLPWSPPESNFQQCRIASHQSVRPTSLLSRLASIWHYWAILPSVYTCSALFCFLMAIRLFGKTVPVFVHCWMWSDVWDDVPCPPFPVAMPCAAELRWLSCLTDSWLSSAWICKIIQSALITSRLCKRWPWCIRIKQCFVFTYCLVTCPPILPSLERYSLLY